MAKRIISVVAVCLLLVTVFAVPSMAYVNSYHVQGLESAMIMLPPSEMFAVDTRYLPINFDEYASVNSPLLLFEGFDTVQAYADQGGDLYIIADDSFSASDGYAYGFSISGYGYDSLPDGTQVHVIDFAINLYHNVNGVWEFVDTVVEPYLIDFGYQDTVVLNIYAYGVISNPNDVSDFFAYMYPMLPLVWTDYAKVTVGTYKSGYVDGEIRGKQRIDQIQYTNGFDAGKMEGFDLGYQEGVQSVQGTNIFRQLIDAAVFAPVNAIVEMMNFEILGVNLSKLALAVISICIVGGIVLFVLRFWV